MNISLEAYLVTVRRKYKRKDAELPFGNFDGKESLRKVISRYLRVYEDVPSKVELLQKALIVDRLEENNKGLLRGVIKVGGYGYSSRIINTETGDDVYRKKRVDADLVPYYFDFTLPDKNKKGLLLIEKSGLHGIRELVSMLVEEPFRGEFEDCTLRINPVMPEEAMKAMLREGGVREIHFIRHVIPSDLADRINGRAVEVEGEYRLVLKPRRLRNFGKRKLRELVEGKAAISELIELGNFDYDNIKVKLELANKRERTIDFGKRALRGSFDISDEIDTGSDGYPTFKSLRASASTLSRELFASLGMNLE